MLNVKSSFLFQRNPISNPFIPLFADDDKTFVGLNDGCSDQDLWGRSRWWEAGSTESESRNSLDTGQWIIYCMFLLSIVNVITLIFPVILLLLMWLWNSLVLHCGFCSIQHPTTTVVSERFHFLISALSITLQLLTVSYSDLLKRKHNEPRDQLEVKQWVSGFF